MLASILVTLIGQTKHKIVLFPSLFPYMRIATKVSELLLF